MVVLLWCMMITVVVRCNTAVISVNRCVVTLDDSTVDIMSNNWDSDDWDVHEILLYGEYEYRWIE